jgi:alpha-tubulin suppressor-like RCC1 family protein
MPVAVSRAGALAGKTVVAISGGASHSLALCSDGTVVAWGYNGSGELGNDSTANSTVPVAVYSAGALSGKTVVRIDAGASHNLALCADGTLVAWGSNTSGLLGNNSQVNSRVPVAINPFGVLSGRTVTGISAGPLHSLAICSDGMLAA